MSTKANGNKEIKAHVPDEDRCQFTTRDGRRCSTPHMGNANNLCILHAGRCQKVDEAEVRAVAEQLFSDCAKLETRAEVSRFMAQLLTLVAQKRISREDGSLLAYIASLLLQTIAPIARRRPIAYEREELMDSFASPIHDGRPTIDQNIAEPIPATREEFNRKVAERFGQQSQMPGRSYNPYTYPSITHKR